MVTKTSIITGGGRGIGKAISLRMSQDNNILLIGRTEKDLKDTASEIKKLGRKVDYIVGDISDHKTSAKAKRKILKNRWIVSSLICNAGIGKSGATELFDKNLWEEIFKVNVHGTFYLIQEFLPEMMKQKSGTICIMSSIAGLKGLKYSTAYSASKHALIGLGKSLAEEYGKYGISVVPICPGFVESDMTTRTIKGLMQRHKITEDQARERIKETNSQKRIIPAEEVAEVISFVCSGKAPSLSGSPLILNGGL